jgi:type IV pilus assembly protein PilM
MAFGLGSQNLLGVDVGSSSVKIVEIIRGAGSNSLRSFGIAPLPPGGLSEESAGNLRAVGEIMRSLIEENKIKTRKSAVSVSGSSVIIKRINVPDQKRKEMAEQILWEAEQYIHFDISEVNIDFHVLGPSPSVPDTVDVQLVAVKKSKIDLLKDALSIAGLIPTVVDVDCFALGNAYLAGKAIIPGENIMLVNVGASNTNINIIENGHSTFQRDVAMAGNQFTEEIQKSLGVTFDEAEQLKFDNPPTQEVEEVLNTISENLAFELKRVLDYYNATISEALITRAMLCGGTSKVKGFGNAVEAALGITADFFMPFEGIKRNKRIFTDEYLDEIGPFSPIALGLALRKVR